MSLINTKECPPKGWLYREPALNWIMPEPFLPFEQCVEAIQAVRMNNLHTGLNTTYKACAQALGDYTCKRMNYSKRFCSEDSATAAVSAAAPKKPRKRCGSCGR